jgi:glutamate decarboxylase
MLRLRFDVTASPPSPYRGGAGTTPRLRAETNERKTDVSSTTESSRSQVGNDGDATAPAIVQEEELLGLPRDELPQHGTGTRVAYDTMTNELLLDGSARLNLATFVTTWMPPDAARLMAETADKNMIDKDEYPQTAEFERRCVNMIGRLWHAASDGDVTGCSTTGSSEAAMLGGLALKWRWRERMEAAGKPTDRPNLVLGINVQVCWDKFLSLLGCRAATRADGR